MSKPSTQRKKPERERVQQLNNFVRKSVEMPPASMYGQQIFRPEESHGAKSHANMFSHDVRMVGGDGMSHGWRWEWVLVETYNPQPFVHHRSLFRWNCEKCAGRKVRRHETLSADLEKANLSNLRFSRPCRISDEGRTGQ